MLKEKIGRALPALAALLVFGASLITSAQAGVTLAPTKSYANAGNRPALSSGNAAEWIAATGAAVAGVTAALAWAGGAAEESTVIIIIVAANAHGHPGLTHSQQASYSSSFDR